MTGKRTLLNPNTDPPIEDQHRNSEFDVTPTSYVQCEKPVRLEHEVCV